MGKKADYITSIEMVDNFLPVFDMNEQMAKDKQVKKHLDQIRSGVVISMLALLSGCGDSGSTSEETLEQESSIQQSETMSPESD